MSTCAMRSSVASRVSEDVADLEAGGGAMPDLFRRRIDQRRRNSDPGGAAASPLPGRIEARRHQQRHAGRHHPVMNDAVARLDEPALPDAQ